MTLVDGLNDFDVNERRKVLRELANSVPAGPALDPAHCTTTSTSALSSPPEAVMLRGRLSCVLRSCGTVRCGFVLLGRRALFATEPFSSGLTGASSRMIAMAMATGMRAERMIRVLLGMVLSTRDHKYDMLPYL